MADIDDDIDQLYRIGLDGFVAARNALAKSAKRPDVKALEKPSAAAWAVNQLYWHDRAVFDRVVAASEAVRAAHRAVLEGATADVRDAEATHRDALKAATTLTRRFLAQGGLAAASATLDAISRTLEALPHPEATGRLITPLTPRGLEALAGLTLAAPLAPAKIVMMPSRRRDPDAVEGDDDQRAREAARRAEALAARRRTAATTLASARAALDAAELGVAEAERILATRKAVRATALDAVARAESALRAVDTFE